MEKYLAPSILSADFKILGKQVKETEDAGTRYLHLDVMDGKFVPNISFGMPVISSLRGMTDMIFDVHLMIEEPIRYVSEFKKAGADIITVHYEAVKDMSATLSEIRESGAIPGIAVNPDTDIEKILPYLDKAGLVLIMSVFPGFGGQKFIEDVYDKIKAVSRIRMERKFDFLIEVDGGISGENAGKVSDCGADVLVAGSAVFKGNIEANIKAITKVI